MSSSSSGQKSTFVPSITVKFHDNVDFPSYEDITYRGITTKQATRQPISQSWSKFIQLWGGLVQQFPGIVMRRQFISLDVAQIQTLVDRAKRTDPTYDPPNFFTYYLIECPPDVDPDIVLQIVLMWDIVEMAYKTEPPGSPPSVTLNDPHWVDQGYLEPKPKGIDVLYVWNTSMPDSAGENVKLVDVEHGWFLDHRDLPKTLTAIDGFNSDDPNHRDHGTKTLGVILSPNNNLGVIGVAFRVNCELVSEHRIHWTEDGESKVIKHDIRDAIMRAIKNLLFGDVLLIESQLPQGFPVEFDNTIYQVIKLATAIGIVVIEPAGNGGNNVVNLDTLHLDGYGYILCRKKDPSDIDEYHDPSDKSHHSKVFRDSGAIMVAGGKMSDNIWSRANKSNYGSRIDCFSWGEEVHTLRYDAGDMSEDKDNLYTTDVENGKKHAAFNGTSSASAIIAGAAILVQSILQKLNKSRLSPAQMRDLFANPAFGTVADPTSRIRVMPDLRAILERGLGAIPDIYIRDNIEDVGDPHKGPVSNSPDVIVWRKREPEPQKIFGQGSGTENVMTLSEEVRPGQDNYLYVRVRNRGLVSAQNTVARVYWSRVSTLITPDMWNHIGEVQFPNVPTNRQLTVGQPLLWKANGVPRDASCCFVVLLHHADDPAPDLADLMNFENYRRFVRDNNNVTWRNFQIVSSTPVKWPEGFVELGFHIAGFRDESIPMRLETIARLPTDARLLLEIPRHAVRTLDMREKSLLDGGGNHLRLQLHPDGVQEIGQELSARRSPLVFPAGFLAQLRLLVDIPPELRGDLYEIVVRQMFEDEELGRVTFLLTPPERMAQLSSRRRRRTQL